MAEEDAQTEAAVPKSTASSGPGRYFVLVLLILLVEGAVGYWVLDQAVPAPEVAPVETEIESAEEMGWVAPI